MGRFCLFGGFGPYFYLSKTTDFFTLPKDPKLSKSKSLSECKVPWPTFVLAPTRGQPASRAEQVLQHVAVLHRAVASLAELVTPASVPLCISFHHLNLGSSHSTPLI
jgi:hypothetical protein